MSEAAATTTLSRGNWLQRTTGALGLNSARLNLRLGLIIVIGWVLVAALAPWIAPYDPIAHDLTHKLMGPSLAHPFGTDNFGRDILSASCTGRASIC